MGGAGRWRRSVSVLLVGIALSAPPGCGGGGTGDAVVPVSAAGSPDPGVPDPAVPGIDPLSAEFLSAVNRVRSSARMCGDDLFPAAPPVSWNDLLATAARLHSEDMARYGFFSHTGSDGGEPWDRISREGYPWWTCGENIAVGYPSVPEVMQGWLGSPGHCRNLMNPDYEEIGAAFAEGPYQGNLSAGYWTFDLAAAR